MEPFLDEGDFTSFEAVAGLLEFGFISPVLLDHNPHIEGDTARGPSVTSISTVSSIAFGSHRRNSKEKVTAVTKTPTAYRLALVSTGVRPSALGRRC